MNKKALLEVARDECVPSGYIIRGYCNVDNSCSVLCTKDKIYSELVGRPSDCIHASKTTKLKCEFWNKIKTPIKIEEV